MKNKKNASNLCKQAHCLVVALLLTPPIALAADNLQTVFQDAADNDPEIRSEQALLRAETDRVDISGGRLYPSLMLSGEVARNREDVEIGAGATGTSGITYFDSNRLELTVTQALYRKDVFTEIDKDEANARVAEFNYRSAWQAFLLRVVSRYFDVLSASNNLTYATTELDAIKRQLRDARALFKAGSGTRADLFEAQASYDLARAQRIITETALEDAHAALEEITNSRYEKLARLPIDFMPAFDGPFELQPWLEMAASDNPELQASLTRIEVLSYEVEQASAGHYPELDVVARYSLEDTGGRFGESETDDRSIALQLKLPIFEGGSVSAEVREANNRLQAEKEKHNKTYRNIRRSVNNSLRSVSSSINQVKALKQALVSAEAALDAIRSGFKAGTRTTTDVLDAQRELFRARRDYMQMQYTFITSLLELKLLVGSLAEADIAMIDSWLRPAS